MNDDNQIIRFRSFLSKRRLLNDWEQALSKQYKDNIDQFYTDYEPVEWIPKGLKTITNRLNQWLYAHNDWVTMLEEEPKHA